MKRRKNSNLHVVREPEDPTDKIIEEIMDELNSEDGVTEKEIQEELARRKEAEEICLRISEKKKTKKNRDCDCGHSNCCDIGVSAD